jgi:hypothetical protein
MDGHVGLYIGVGKVIEMTPPGLMTTTLNKREKGGKWAYWAYVPEKWLCWAENVQAYLGVPAPGKPAQDPTGGLLKGDRVRVKPDAKEYYPGLKIPEWVPGKVYTVSQVLIKGEPFICGGKVCVLLADLVTWCAVENLEKAED